ncbi:MAG: molybdate ABC transporter substrate-binding protein [Alphaproteobacteria bacterium]
MTIGFPNLNPTTPKRTAIAAQRVCLYRGARTILRKGQRIDLQSVREMAEALSEEAAIVRIRLPGREASVLPKKVTTIDDLQKCGTRATLAIPPWVIAIIGLLALGLGTVALSGRATAADKMIVFAAASLKESLDEVAANFSKQPDAPKVVVSYAGSSALAKQIAQAAPADIFISADEAWMDDLDGRDLILKESRHDLLGNKLVLIVPASFGVKGAPTLEATLKDLSRQGLAMADPDSVPAGKYGKAALMSLKAWEGVAPQVIRAENVRAALAIVARGEARYGIVYATDAAAEPKVRILHRLPDTSYPEIRYPVAIVKTAMPRALQFLTYLKSPAAKTVFEKYGFTFLAEP